jgi:hypothetical protein
VIILASFWIGERLYRTRAVATTTSMGIDARLFVVGILLVRGGPRTCEDTDSIYDAG